MADQSLFQGSQQSQTLLAHRREIAADTAEGHCTSRGAETAGDLLRTFTMRRSRSARLLSEFP